MQIIPVIDIKQGRVVHARQGLRDSYQPIRSSLCRSPDVFDVLASFRSLHPFSVFYIADLDAITREGNNGSLIEEVIGRFPESVFWVDSGFPLYENGFRGLTNYLPVLGSESLRDDELEKIAPFGNRFVLSLDFSQTGKMGATSLFADTSLWPDKIIVMSLPRVGSNLGPDTELLTDYCLKYPDKKFIAAGGVRDSRDLLDLKRIGVDHALLATALHNGKISPDEIAGLQAKKYPA